MANKKAENQTESQSVLSRLSQEEQTQLVSELKDLLQQQPSPSSASDEHRMLQMVAEISDTNSRVKYRDSSEFFRKDSEGNSTDWTFYVHNPTSSDVIITDLAGEGKDGEIRVKVYANSGENLLNWQTNAEKIRDSGQLANYLRPNGELQRMTPEDWDRRVSDFEKVKEWRSTFKEERRKIREEYMRLGQKRSERIFKTKTNELRLRSPKRPKIVALVDRIRNGQITEQEVLSRVLAAGGLNEFEHRLMQEAVNDFDMPAMYRWLQENPGRAVSEEEIQLSMKRAEELERLRNN